MYREQSPLGLPRSMSRPSSVSLLISLALISLPSIRPCRRFCRYQARCETSRLLPRPARADRMAVSGALGALDCGAGMRLISSRTVCSAVCTGASTSRKSCTPARRAASMHCGYLVRPTATQGRWGWEMCSWEARWAASSVDSGSKCTKMACGMKRCTCSVMLSWKRHVQPCAVQHALHPGLGQRAFGRAGMDEQQLHLQHIVERLWRLAQRGSRCSGGRRCGMGRRHPVRWRLVQQRLVQQRFFLGHRVGGGLQLAGQRGRGTQTQQCLQRGG